MDSVRLHKLAIIELKAADAFREEAQSAYRLSDSMVDPEAAQIVENEGDIAFDSAEYHLKRAAEFRRLRDRAKVRELRVRFSG